MSYRNRKKKEPDFFADTLTKLKSININAIKSGWQRLPGGHQKALIILIPFVIILMVLPHDTEENSAIISSETTRTEVAINTTSLTEQGNPKSTVMTTSLWQEYKVQSGDTLAKIFRSNHLPMADFNALVAIEGIDKPLSKIKAGQLIRYKLKPNGDLDILQLEKDDDAIMFLRLTEGGFGRSY